MQIPARNGIRVLAAAWLSTGLMLTSVSGNGDQPLAEPAVTPPTSAPVIPVSPPAVSDDQQPSVDQPANTPEGNATPMTEPSPSIDGSDGSATLKAEVSETITPVGEASTPTAIVETTTQPGTASPEPVVAEVTRPTGPVELRFAFESTPWRDVIDWLAEQSGMALHVGELPPGSFTYSDPSTFTINEAIDRVNLFLLPQGYALVRGGQLLSVLNLDDPRSLQQLDVLARQVDVEQLADLDAHDVVKCFFPLGELEPEDATAEVGELNLMTTPTVFEKTKRMMIVDTVAKLRSVHSILSAFVPSTMDNGTVVESFLLKHVEAEDVLVVARPHLGLATGEMIGIDVSISADPTGKQIFVTGVEDKVKLIEGLITQVDQPKASMASSDQPSVLRSHFVQGGNLRNVYDVLQTILTGEEVRLSIDEESSSLVALASATTQEKISQTITEMQASDARFEIIPLKHIDAYLAVSLLEEMLDLSERKLRAQAGMEAFTRHGNSRGLDLADDPDTSDYHKIDADPINKRLFVRAKPHVLEQIKEMVTELDSQDSLNSADTFRLLTFEATGQGERILATTARFWREENPILLYREPAEADSSTKERTFFEPLEITVNDALQSSRDAQGDVMVSAQTSSSPMSIFETSGETIVLAGDPSSQAPAIRCQLTMTGLILQCDDSAALSEFEQQLRTIAGPLESLASPPVVFYLKYTKADEAIRMLAELLDGGAAAASAVDEGSLVNSGSYNDSGFFMSSIVTSREGTLTMMGGSITVVADARLNRLIAQGSASDLKEIEGYLEIIDKDRSITSIETYGTSRVIELQNIRAEEVETVIRSVYAGRVVKSESAKQQTQSPQDAKQAAIEAAKAAREASKGRSDANKPNTKESPSNEPQMTLAVHAPSNSLIVTAPEALFLEVERLALQLDDRGKQSVEVVVPVGGPAMQDMLRQVLLGEEPERSDRRRSSARSK